MRILWIVALAIVLVSCTGDRVKQGMNSPQEQPLGAGEATSRSSEQNVTIGAVREG
jgi:hypothetical protein